MCVSLQWNGSSFFSMREIFSSMCCMCFSSWWDRSWTADTSPTRFRACNFPDSTPCHNKPSHLRASCVFSPKGKVIATSDISLCWFYLLEMHISQITELSKVCVFYGYSFGSVLVSRAIRAAHCLTSIQVSRLFLRIIRLNFYGFCVKDGNHLVLYLSILYLFMLFALRHTKIREISNLIVLCNLWNHHFFVSPRAQLK